MYFCVKIPLRIAGKHYRPCISYKIGENMLSTAKKLAEEGKAEVSETPIFFQNGKKIVKKEEKTVENGEKQQKKAKKAKKDKKVEVKDIEELAKEAEIVPLDDVSEEENGGF